MRFKAMNKISERQLENWLCEHFKETCYPLDVIGRQIPLEHGVLDILATNGMAIYAVELKARPLREEDVGQVLRYVHDLNGLLSNLWFDVREWLNNHQYDPQIDREILKQLERVHSEKEKSIRAEFYRELMEQSPKCFFMLVGPSIDDKTLASIKGADGWVMIWEYLSDRQAFYTYPPEHNYSINPRPPSYGISWLEGLMHNYLAGINEYIEYEFDRCARALFDPSEAEK